MRKKSPPRYALGGAVEAPPPAATVDINTNNSPEDDASRAFMGQIEALRKSEEMQRELHRQQTTGPRFAPITRAERLLHFRNQGIGQSDAEYLADLNENPDLATEAVNHARREGDGNENSPSFHTLVKHKFRELMDDTPEVRPSMDPTKPSPRANEFPTAKRAKMDPHNFGDVPDPPSGIQSGPVTRNVPVGAGQERP